MARTVPNDNCTHRMSRWHFLLPWWHYKCASRRPEWPVWKRCQVRVTPVIRWTHVICARTGSSFRIITVISGHDRVAVDMTSFGNPFWVNWGALIVAWPEEGYLLADPLVCVREGVCMFGVCVRVCILTSPGTWGIEGRPLLSPHHNTLLIIFGHAVICHFSQR